MERLTTPWAVRGRRFREGLKRPLPPAWSDGIAVFSGLKLRPGKLLLIAGEPGVGKSSAALQIVVDCLARNPELKAVVASVEMSPETCLERQLARLARLPLDRIAAHATTEADDARLGGAFAVLDGIGDRLMWCDEPHSLRAAVRLAALTGADLLLLDFVQEMEPASDPTQTDEYARLSALVRDLGKLCVERDLAVIAVSSLRRSGGANYGRPGLSSLRGSGSLEYRATDVVLMSRHPEGPNPGDREHDDPEARRVARRGPVGVLIDHAKNRHGPVDSFRAIFEREHQAFRMPRPDDDLGPTSAGPPDPASFRPLGATTASPAPGATPAADDPDDDGFDVY
ncbi:DnaB-like helicase C-terminal domain-containing protein [Paludisphaera sp.]|uniref:DnaB-like helicase C-terminal domain-containing protein n=1 Tax=Paludisphaera sp. TaxID=2017432 RepID=UPI00301DA57D